MSQADAIARTAYPVGTQPTSSSDQIDKANAGDRLERGFAVPDGGMAGNQTKDGQIATPPKSEVVELHPPAPGDVDIMSLGNLRRREKFIPVTRFALMERLTQPQAWRAGEANAARRFFTYIDYWRHQRYNVRLLDLEQTYEAFSPDSDFLLTRKYTPSERATMQRRIVAGMTEILEQANYEQIDPNRVEIILTKESHYGLDLHVDFSVFDECLIFYRGASSTTDQRRPWRKFYRKEEFEVPVFQRLFLLFKLKPIEQSVQDEMVKQNLTHEEATKKIKKIRRMLPKEVKEQNIYMKLFKNIPRSDVEMVFPNTVVKFRLFDKIKLGVTSAGGLGMSIAGGLGKLALILTNPILALGALGGIGAVIFRQIMSFFNQKQRYMVTMAQNLYFHSLADNHGVMIKLADRAAEEDVKEEILLYSVLCKEPARRSDLKAIDSAIEHYLKASFGVDVDFDVHDALGRLLEDGIVTEGEDGLLYTLPPTEAAKHIDTKWDLLLDELPDQPSVVEGLEFEGTPQPRESVLNADGKNTGEGFTA